MSTKCFIADYDYSCEAEGNPCSVIRVSLGAAGWNGTLSRKHGDAERLLFQMLSLIIYTGGAEAVFVAASLKFRGCNIVSA